MRRLLLATMPLWTSGCGGAAGSEPAAVAVVNPCDALPLPSYTPAFNAGVADELAALRAGAKLRIVTRDYIATRDGIRACRSVQP